MIGTKGSKLAFKAFNENLISKYGFEYKIGETYEIKEDPIIGKLGFHFCCMPLDLDMSYSNSKQTTYAIVEIDGKVVHRIYMSVTNKIKIIQQITREQLLNYISNGIFEAMDGRIYYFKDNKFHRDNDLPAIEFADGHKEWYIDGIKHRHTDLPSIVYGDGFMIWMKNGIVHRDTKDLHDNDLPAVRLPNGSAEWWKNDKFIKFDDNFKW
jgi:hypothetical protein